MFDLLIITITGFLGGFVGAQVGSGAMITLPALLFLGLSPTLAIGTNMLSAWLINVAAFLKYFKSGRIILEAQTASFSVVAFVGSLIGAQLLLYIDKSILAKIVVFFFIALVVFVLKKPPLKSNDTQNKIKQWHIDVAAILAFVTGIYGGFFTVAVTTFFMFILCYLLGKSLLEAAAESVFIVSIVLSVALLVFIKAGNINYYYAIPLAISSVIGSWVGAAAALKFGDKWLRGLMIATVIVVIVKLLGGF